MSLVVVSALLSLLLPSAASAATELPAKITENMTLTSAGSPYTGTSTIESGATVKAEPGVELTAVTLTIKGTLDVEGTSEKPVVFTGSGYSTLTFEPGSGSSVVDHAEIIKGGGEYCCPNVYAAIAIKGSSPTISNSTITESKYMGIEVTKGGSPELTNDHIYKSKYTSIYYSVGKEDTGEVNIHGNVIEGGGGTGIYVSISGTGVSAKTLSGNTITGKEGLGLYYSGPDIPGDITENTLSGNKTNIIEIGGTVAHSSTWKYGGTEVKLASEVTVASGVTLKIAQGVYLANSKFTIKGTLDVEGTSEKPVVFTGSGYSTLTFEPGSGSSVVDHAEIIKGGGEYCCGNVYAAVKIKKASPTITNSTFLESSAPAIEVTESGSPRIEWNRFRRNSSGLSYSGTGKLSAPNNDWNCTSGPKGSRLNY